MRSTRRVRDARCRAVLLTGAGRGFCAGQDLIGAQPVQDGRAARPGRDADALLQSDDPPDPTLEKPVVCAVNGVAAGAGANLALACDIVLAARSAKFIQSFSRVGLVPDAGGSWMLPRLIGEARAKAIAMTAEPVTAEKARRALGHDLEDRYGDAELMDEARALAARLAVGPTCRARR
jgi:2-(1,2-epoxy-1,2-dihydrophenyl)acetyl-CoA isomerase